MAKHVCIKNYTSPNGYINFKIGDVYDAEPYGSTYTTIRTEGDFLCLVKSEQFLKYFKRQFTFGR
jgi:hypothetical protein